MSLQFNALEVGSGDAFLIEEEEKKYLFDAGGSKSTIVNLLRKKKINKLDLAICSHNDIDHANGFIGLLESSIDIDEIWLPGTWTSILQYVKDNGVGPEVLDFLFDLCESEESQHEISDNLKEDIYNHQYVEISDFDEHLSYFSDLYENYILSQSQFYLCRHFFYHGFSSKTLSLFIQLDKIIKIAALAYQKGCKILWFEPLDSCAQNDVAYGFRALNSQKVVTVKRINKDPISFFYLLNLTVENEYSLIFEFLHGNKPIVRFSADSAQSCQSETPYSQNIIITAPHHGSDANACVYNTIKGDDIVWVRSDRKSSKRPCQEFKKLKEKYCLACFTKKFKKEVRFEYDNRSKKWNYQSGNKCNC